MQASTCARFSLNPLEALFSVYLSMDSQIYQQFIDYSKGTSQTFPEGADICQRRPVGEDQPEGGQHWA
jgi:hypothetical protein